MLLEDFDKTLLRGYPVSKKRQKVRQLVLFIFCRETQLLLIKRIPFYIAPTYTCTNSRGVEEELFGFTRFHPLSK